MFDYAVVGSGIGGSSIAALLQSKGYNVALFEKEPYLGGCSSTFMHKGHLYNTGATTFSGYDEHHVVKTILDEIGFKPDLIETDPSIVILQNGKTTPRYRDFHTFLKVLNKNYPHTKNIAFWELIYEINQTFHTYQNYYYSNRSIFAKLRSLITYLPLFVRFKKYLAINAHTFIRDFFTHIDDEYLQFLESQILIVAQASTKKINFFTAALALAYTFNKNYYAMGGMGAIFDGLTQNISHLYKNSDITSIEYLDSHFKLHTKKRSYQSKNVILNSTVYESANLFTNSKIKHYYQKYEKLNNHQSSFMLYMTIKSSKTFHHHYQIIKNKPFIYTLSQALFVSFSDQSDRLLAKKGEYSITASIHTDTRFWENPNTYKAQKQKLQQTLLKVLLDEFGITQDEIVDCFAATPKSFKHYIKRSQLGGNAMSMKNFLPRLPSNDTPIKNLYHVGDSVYAAQGWPGVMMGVKNLKKLLRL